MGSRLRQARNGSLGRVFDHVGIAVSGLAASERFYRTVLSILGVEPSHAAVSRYGLYAGATIAVVAVFLTTAPKLIARLHGST